MFARFSLDPKPIGKPFLLSDKKTGSGKGYKVCLVSDSTAKTAPTAEQAAVWLNGDGWDVTLLDLSSFKNVPGKPHTIRDDNRDPTKVNAKQTAKAPYRYVQLAGKFKETNWYTPMQSLCAYHWLKDKDFDLIIFQHGFGAGHFSCTGRDVGLAFAKTALVVWADDPFMHWLEDAKWMPAAVRTDMEIDFLERETVRRADGVLFTVAKTLPWMAMSEWELPPADQVALLGEDKGQPVGKWLVDCVAAARQRPAIAPEKPDVLISICMATYNRPGQLRQAIASLETQTYKNFELVVMDDGSTNPGVDALRLELEPLFAQRGWRWEKQANAGPSVARRHAVSLAKADWLLFMDDDNIALPDELEIFARASYSGADLFTCICGLDPRSEPPPPIAYLPGRPACKNDNFPVSWLPYGANVPLNILANTIGETNALYSRKMFEALGGFQGDRTMLMEDWDIFIRAAIAGYHIEVIPEVALIYLRHDGSRHIHGSTVMESHVDTLKPIAALLPPAFRPLLLALRAPMGNAMHGLHGLKFPGRYRNDKTPVAPHRLFRPRVSDTPINIALWVDDTCALPTCVMLTSLFSSNPQPIDIHILSSLSKDKEASLALIAAHFNQCLNFIPVKEDMGGLGDISSLYSRVFLPEYLPHLDRVLSLDSAVIVRHDVGKLWNVDLGDQLMGAVSDSGYVFDAGYLKQYGGDFFNSGVMLIDLARWRHEGVIDETIKWIRHFDKKSDPHQYRDQAPLNMAVAGRWMSLSPTWNLSELTHVDTHRHFRIDRDDLESIRRDPHIFRFIDPLQPWIKEWRNRTEFAREYQVYEKFTQMLLGRAVQEPGLEKQSNRTIGV